MTNSYPTQVEPALLDALVMRVRHDPALLPDLALLGDHEVAIERVYRATTGGERCRALDMEARRLASGLGLDARVREVLAQYPGVEARLAQVVLALARPGEQRADAHGPDSTGRFSLVIHLELDVWLDAARTGKIVHHEVLHAADMLDPAFAYDAGAAWPGATHGQRHRARKRFTALWCSTVDARLARAGREPVAGAAVYATELARLFPGARGEEFGELVADLYDKRRWTHADLLALAARPDGDRPGGRAASGAPCPLCGFPSSQWAPPSIPDILAGAIRKDFPAWQVANGCCLRCLECYEARPHAALSPSGSSLEPHGRMR